jgi:endonuclease YncB( thermonuclease family)
VSRKLLSNRTYSLLSLLVVVFLLLAQHFGWFDQFSQQATESQPGLYSVARFVDGDTIAVKMGDATETVRMIGVDTPETHRPNTPVQCYGPAAAAFTKNLIGNNKVRLQADSKSQNRDRYDRLLRYVYLPDGRLVQQEVIQEGFGFAYTQFPFTKSAELVQDQAAAQQAGKGLWANCKPTQETTGRWQTEPTT